MKLSTLKKSASRSTHSRGHRLKWETHDGLFGQNPASAAIGVCKCGSSVFCTTAPWPNQTHIMGSAVAVNCTL